MEMRGASPIPKKEGAGSKTRTTPRVFHLLPPSSRKRTLSQNVRLIFCSKTQPPCRSSTFRSQFCSLKLIAFCLLILTPNRQLFSCIRLFSLSASIFCSIQLDAHVVSRLVALSPSFMNRSWITRCQTLCSLIIFAYPEPHMNSMFRFDLLLL